LDNYGVATAYSGKKEVPEDRRFLCATFNCLRIQPPPTPGQEQWLKLQRDATDTTGFADSGCGGSIEAELKKSSGLAVQAFFPQLLNAVGITPNFDWSKGSTLKLVISKACNRKLYQRKTLDYISGLQKNDDPFGLQSAYTNDGGLVLIIADVVIQSMDIQVKTNNNLKVAIEGKLKGEAEKTFGEGSGFKVGVTRVAEGDYHLKITSPVIVGILPAYQARTVRNSRGGERENTSWFGWHPTTVTIPSQ
jgi:hypothetical protein